MNSPSEKLPFNPHLKLLAQSLVEFRTGFSENDYLEVVSEIARHLNLSHKPNCLLLAEKDSSRHLLKYLLAYYLEQSPLLLANDNLFNGKQQESISHPNNILVDEHKVRDVRVVAASALGNLGQADERVILALFTALKDVSLNVRVYAALALVNWGHTDARIIVALSEALQDKSMKRKVVAIALAKTLLGNNYSSAEVTKVVPELTKRRLFDSQNRSLILKEEEITSYILEFISLSDWQSVFDTPNAVRTIIKAFMREEAADSIYYALPFFNIRRLKLPIALELVQDLANPMTDERTKLAIFQLLMHVELVDEQGQPLRQEIKAK